MSDSKVIVKDVSTNVKDDSNKGEKEKSEKVKLLTGKFWNYRKNEYVTFTLWDEEVGAGGTITIDTSVADFKSPWWMSLQLMMALNPSKRFFFMLEMVCPQDGGLKNIISTIFDETGRALFQIEDFFMIYFQDKKETTKAAASDVPNGAEILLPFTFGRGDRCTIPLKFLNTSS
jgi:hypothetical protein